MCTRVICIDRGSIVLETDNIEDAIKEYHQNSKDRDSKTK